MKTFNETLGTKTMNKIKSQKKTNYTNGKEICKNHK